MDEKSDKEIHMTIVAINYTLSVMSGKWKWLIIGILEHHGVQRYSDVKAILSKCSHKVLSQQLRELELDGVIVRTSYNEIPPRVEYSISEKGIGLMHIIREMLKWGFQHMEYDEDALKSLPLDASGNKRKKRAAGAKRRKIK